MDIIKQNKSLITMIFIWLISGSYLNVALGFVVVIISLFLLKSRNMNMEILIGLFFHLILSDERGDIQKNFVFLKDIYLFIMAGFLILDRKTFTSSNRFYVSFVPFFLIASACMFFAPSEILLTSMEKTLSYFLLMLVVPNYFQLCQKEHGDFFYKTLIYFCTGILLMGFFNKFTGLAFVNIRGGRYRGVFGNPNGLGLFCVLFFMLYWVIKSVKPGIFKKKENIFILTVILISLYLSDSRNSIMALGIFFLFSFLHRISGFLGILIFIVVVSSYSYIEANFITIVSSLGFGSYFRLNTLSDAAGRLVAWQFAWENVHKSIYWGHGFDYTERLFFVNRKYLLSRGHQGNAHNTFLTLWLDTGLFGLATYLLAFISKFFIAAKESPLALPIMYAILFTAFFESWLESSLNPFTIICLMILTVLIKSDATEPSPDELAVSLV
jgi:O-antigen ligase